MGPQQPIRTPWVAITALVTLIAGCSHFDFFRDRGGDYLKAENLPPVSLPESVDRPPFNDLLPVPAVQDPRGISGQAFEVPLPEPLPSGYTIDQIVLKKLGNKHWIFLDASTASIWPRLREFWATNNLTIEQEDPGKGYIETTWLPSTDGTADQIYESLVKAGASADSAGTVRNKFRMQVEAGVRQGSSEVRIAYLKTDASGAQATVQWPDMDAELPADQIAMRDKMLSSLAYFLGEKINSRSSVSLMASRMEEKPKTELVPDRQRPQLKYELDFDRTWATVGSALELAGIEIEERLREERFIRVVYRDRLAKAPGWFSRLFRSESKGKGENLLVRLEPSGNDVLVSIFADETNPASPEIAEQLLQIIKEYST